VRIDWELSVLAFMFGFCGGLLLGITRTVHYRTLYTAAVFFVLGFIAGSLIR
jgi:ABC-type amino acid transport system permease subunit